ncbi:hypothetical protein [Actinomadura sp. DC4]|uniref:hypothetical protein n=1 Tax=Actinomadura sp. DC4 TaxID=3055069 RepID=UPI0025B0D59A|nr:hypothetical protein [Actinomadura sp. DC4]MDN3352014.1 hypothetical protein [Actinomadura sp. DC4]
MVTGVTISLLSLGGQKVLESPDLKGPPISVRSIVLQRDADLAGDTFAFERPLDLAKRELDDIDAGGDLDGWAREHGGVDVQMVMAQVVLAGNQRDPVRILGMKAINQCRPPLTGTLIEKPTGGEDDTVRLAFDLDERNPEARTWQGGSAGFGKDYFGAKTVSLKYKEQQTFQMIGITQRQYCEFHLQVSVLAGKRTETVPVTNGGRPFKVTSLSGRTSAPDYSDYQKLYVGGVANTLGHGALIRADPSRYPAGY